MFYSDLRFGHRANAGILKLFLLGLGARGQIASFARC